MLEEIDESYRIAPVDIFKGEQFEPEFLAIAPNNRIPALLDSEPSEGEKPVDIFENGAILNYLAEKSWRFIGADVRSRFEIQQWLHWQTGGLGPMMGRASHFINYATEDLPYARQRYMAETERLFGVMERRLSSRDFLAGDDSISDIACYPWVRLHDVVNVSLAPYPNLQSWTGRISQRPAVARAYTAGEPLKAHQKLDDRARRILFGQGPANWT